MNLNFSIYKKLCFHLKILFCRVDELVLVKGTTVAIFLGEKHYAVVPESFY